MSYATSVSIDTEMWHLSLVIEAKEWAVRQDVAPQERPVLLHVVESNVILKSGLVLLNCYGEIWH